jgi:hypothetical protein
MRGEDHAEHKLTEDDVRVIRSLRGIIGQRSLAHYFGISQTRVGQVQRLVAWAHVEP